MIPMGNIPPSVVAIGKVFTAIGKIFKFVTSPAVQLSLFVAQGVMAHRAAMKAKRTGADILLQKYGTGAGMPVIYGTRRVGSTVVYMNTINNKELFVVYAIAGHEIDSFDLESIHLDGRTIKDLKIYRQGYDISDGSTRINFRPSGETRASGAFWGNTSTERANITGGANTGDNARMTFNCHVGTDSQAADPMLEGIISEWTSNHKLSGVAYIAANYEYDIQGMFTGIPNLTVVVNGKKVFDPRDTGQTFGTESTYTHSSNAALCLLDYITNDEYGKGLGSADLESDFASWKTAANDCDTSADTITHSSIVVERASTTTDRLTIANANEDDYNNFKIGNKFTITDGVTTYVSSKKLIDKDSSLIDIDGTNPVATLQLTFESGAVDTAITSNTTCTFTETQIRFDCNGVLDTDETVLENTKLLIANMRGIFTYSNGEYQIKVEGTESSVVSLDEDDILDSGITLSLENKEAKYNKVESEFYNAQKRYESDTTYYTGETSDSFLSDDGNEVLETRIQLPFCTNQRIAYNHAKAMLKRSRSQKSIAFVATPKVLKAKVGEVISITSSNLNLSSEQYRITNMVINPDLNISVNAVEYQTAVYGYVTPPDEEIGIIQDPVDGYRVEAPTGLTFTNKNSTTGEAAKLTWTDSSKYPSYEFRVQIIDGVKTRYDRRVKDTTFYLDGISVANGYTAKVSAINALGVESDTTDITVNVTTAPVTTPDIEQGSVGGFNFTATKMYYGTAGNFNNTDTAVYFDNAGQFSLKDKLSWNGTTLNISGNLTVENTITADKIVVDGINLDNLISASTQSGSIYLTEFTGIKIATSGSGSGYPPLLKLQDDTATDAFTDITQSQTGINIRARAGTTKGTIRFQGRDSGITPVNYGGFDSDGNWEIGTTDVIKATRDIANVQSIALDSNTPATTTNKLYQASGTLYWNGNQVGVGAINSVTNMADNRILTASGSNSVNGEANLTFDGSTLALTGSQTISSNLTVTGDLTVNGTTTTLNTATLDVEDKNITLNYGAGDTSASANGAGITIQDAVNSTTNATILWDATNDEFDFSHPINVTGTITSSGRVSADELTITNDAIFNGGAEINGDASFGDNNKAIFGAGSDLQIYHNGTSGNNNIENHSGGLYITQYVDDADIFFRSDDGSGGVTEYFRVDGGSSNVLFSKNLKLSDSASLQIGSGNDFTAGHNGTNTFVANNTGILYITQNTDDANFLLRADNGSGGVANYVVLKGSTGEVLLNHYGNNRFKTTADGVNVMNGGLYFAGTQVITSARNLVNIGTISSGKIGVGANTASYWSQANSLVLDDSGNTGLTIKSGTSGNGRIVFTDTTSTTAGLNDGGQIHYGHTNDEMKIRTAGTDALTISSSQNATFAGTISSGDITVNDQIIASGDSDTYLQFHAADQFRVVTGGAERLEVNTSETKLTSGNLNVISGQYLVNGTAVIDSSRNLTNIGTISSGAITSSGQVYADELRVTNDALFEGSIDAGNNTIASGAIESSASVTANTFMQIVGASGSSGFMYIYDRDNGTSNTDGFLLQKSGNNAFVYNRESSGSLSLGAGDTSNYLVIDSSGNIDLGSTQILDQSRNLTNIGTISSGALTVTADAGNEQITIKRSSNTNEQLILGFHSSDYATIQAVEQNVAFRPLVLQPSGANVGIGTTSPDEKLDVEGNLRLESSSSNGTYLALRNSATNGRNYRIGSNFVTGTGELAIYDDVAGVERLRIDSSGNTIFKPSGSETGRFTSSGLSVQGNTAISGNYNTNLGGYQVGGTTVITSARALTNIDSLTFTGTSGTTVSIPSHSGFEIDITGSTAGNIRANDDLYLLSQTGKLHLGANGTNSRLVVNENGLVGIGATSPSYKLDVNSGTTDEVARFQTTANARIKITSSNTANAILDFGDSDSSTIGQIDYDNLDNSMRFVTNAGERMRIDSSGRLGIGTVSPATKLEITDATSPVLKFLRTSVQAWRIGINGSDFRIDPQSDTLASPSLTINSAGNVGIATTGAVEKLQVQGNIRASGAYKIGGNKVIEQVGTTLNIGDVNNNDYIVDITAYGDTSSIVMNDGFIDVVGDFDIAGALSKNSGSFKIDHPLKPETHDLVHSFVESPQADNLYRGVIDLHNGRVTIDLDEWFGMTPGTFLALNRDIQAFVNNADTWDNVRAKVMGSQLVIECQNPESSAEVSWLVIGERQDKEIHESSLTDDHGKVIVEPQKVG